jgi:hypothetical protein
LVQFVILEDKEVLYEEPTLEGVSTKVGCSPK